MEIIKCIQEQIIYLSTGLGKLGELVSAHLLGEELLVLLGVDKSSGASLGSSQEIRAVEGTSELLVEDSGDLADVVALDDGGLGDGGGDLGGRDVGELVGDGDTVLDGRNRDSLHNKY